MYSILRALVWVVSIGSGVFCGAGQILFAWYLTDAFRSMTYAGWIFFFTELSLAFLLPFWFVRGLGWVLIDDQDRW